MVVVVSADPGRIILHEGLRAWWWWPLLPPPPPPPPSLGGLNPAYLSELGSILSSSARSILCDASIICSNMASVGDRQALQAQEELPVHAGSSSEEPLLGLLLLLAEEDRTLLLVLLLL
jgi:hypothetical protein